MNTLLLATLINIQPLPSIATQRLEDLFQVQQDAVLQDIRIGIQADLERKAARFFSAEGAWQQQLQEEPLAEKGFAAR